jgi:hypothetical protein
LSHNTYQRFTPDQKALFYTSLADILIQLRRLELDAIGRVSQRPDGSFTVDQPVATIDMNAQALEGLRPSRVLEQYNEGGPLRKSSQYIDMLHDLAENAFAESRSSVLDDQDEGEEYLYHLHGFREYTKSWRAEENNEGPFVLVHGDLQPFNLLVDHQGAIVSVLDWEWSRVVPCQFFKPPLWLQYADLTLLSRPPFYNRFLETLRDFLTILRRRELEAYGNSMLADEWTLAQDKQGFLVANALESWTHVDWLMHNYVVPEIQGKDGLEDRIRDVIRSDPQRPDLVARKVTDGKVYPADIERLEGEKRNGGHEDDAVSGNRRKLAYSSRFFQYIARLRETRFFAVSEHVSGTVIVVICGGACMLGSRMAMRWLQTLYTKLFR